MEDSWAALVKDLNHKIINSDYSALSKKKNLNKTQRMIWVCIAENKTQAETNNDFGVPQFRPVRIFSITFTGNGARYAEPYNSRWRQQKALDKVIERALLFIYLVHQKNI